MGRSVAGTPLYLAPEVLAGAEPTVATDLYALAVLLFHLVTGRYPVEARTLEALREAHRRSSPGGLRALRPDLPSGFVRVVERALATDPRERYPSAGALEAALADSVRAAGPGAFRRTAPLWTFAGLAAAAVAIVLWLQLGSGPGPSRDRSLAGRAAEARDPSEASPLLPALEARLFRRAADGAREELRSGDRVSLGDRVFLEVETGGATWLYVANEDERGEAYALWPEPGATSANPLPPGSHRLPVEGETWRFTTAGLRERILVLACSERAVALEEELSRLAAPRRADRAPELGARARRTTLLLRSLGEIAEDPPPGPSRTLDPLREEARRLAKAYAGRARLVEFELRNPPAEGGAAGGGKAP